MSSSVLSETDQAFLSRLEAVDFGSIASKLICTDEGEHWSLGQATQAIEQYRRFLFLHHRYPMAQLVPSAEIDRVWHMHILDTVKYREDCEHLFGRFIDHYPYFGLGHEAEHRRLQTAYAETLALTEQCFGR
jgi:hypothetical protein